MTLDRRSFLVASTGLFASAVLPQSAFAAGRDPRFVVIILRGALDGLAAVPPVGDPDFAALRPPAWEGDALPLNGFFALNPAMPNLKRLYGAGQAAIVHASATPYRNRSHFDGQDVLESGYDAPGHADTGWLNRLILSLGDGEKIGTAPRSLSVGTLTPLVIRGEAPLLGWAPQQLKAADPDLAPRLLRLYGESDPALMTVLQEGIDTGKIASGMNPMSGTGGPAGAMVDMAKGAAALMGRDDGPRIAAMAFDGWDTHAAEQRRLTQLLGGLDQSLAALEQGMGPKWADTVVLVATEFGRTARFNGTQGSDHGQATTAFLAGGAVRGGRVIADWPGLKAAQLYEGRDLAPTTDLRAVVMGVARDHLGADVRRLQTDVFPGALSAKPLDGLVGA
ncbi:DUF1501 domain-containing protein [Asticcacaulis sp. DW145]|uniref:DUF1501 domain-containing protein n=1 Tax=Asticcacaulis currens TaxID=2984210 RepID=A0ABT5IEV6_9CAUL|nr:DUF1501 domain-containing protein [Asticcacaulis currens]MDC7694727.1 DUF1501 domain-containing protein [Asticcacaulis currens]BEV11153.1 DUF1501 domain-containing protein [Asticcacaulis sp. DW145]